MTPQGLTTEYRRALRAYVTGGSEAALTRAYELGRTAASSGLGILEVAMLHHESLDELSGLAGASGPPLSMAAQFFSEVLSPYEMALRSYRANARLLGLSETLAERNSEIDRAREQLRTILDATTAVIYLKDADGRYLFVNQRFAELFRVERDDVIGKLDDEVLPTDVASTLHHDDVAVLGARAPHELEEVVPSPDGPHTFLSLKFPLLDAGGAPYAICCVATNITERKRAELAAQEAREAAERQRSLEQAVRARDQFLAIAAHELRTPLTSLTLQVENFRRASRTHAGSATYAQMVDTRVDNVARHVERLTQLVNTLLAVAKIRSGPLELSNDRVDLGEVIDTVIARMGDAIGASRSAVSVQRPDEVVGCWDRQCVETVVGNLLANAVKFGEGKPVEISVDVHGERASITVQDHGIGISPPDVKRIFERFERAVPLTHFGGFGIGLWVARKTVEALGGAIRVSSAPGQGSTFVVELPLNTSATGPEPGQRGAGSPAPR